MRDPERERQRLRQREKQAPCREPDVGLNPRSWDLALSRRQMLNHEVTQASLELFKNFGHLYFQIQFFSPPSALSRNWLLSLVRPLPV